MKRMDNYDEAVLMRREKLSRGAGVTVLGAHARASCAGGLCADKTSIVIFGARVEGQPSPMTYFCHGVVQKNATSRSLCEETLRP